ncbi:MAG: hypothetical protein HY044_00030 [Candidatus Woesebacteria bacterium]|nr:MAG: hypothetical protein HY044_00030 [Candidatus Woesebacteria bacterium]
MSYIILAISSSVNQILKNPKNFQLNPITAIFCELPNLADPNKFFCYNQT